LHHGARERTRPRDLRVTRVNAMEDPQNPISPAAITQAAA